MTNKTIASNNAADSKMLQGRKATSSGPSSGTGKSKPLGKPAVRRQTRQNRLAGMLRRKDGATIAQIIKAFDWQPHTARAAFQSP